MELWHLARLRGARGIGAARFMLARDEASAAIVRQTVADFQDQTGVELQQGALTDAEQAIAVALQRRLR